MFNKKNKAFTLIELLVVISIIGLLSSVVLVGVKEAKERARIANLMRFEASIDGFLRHNILAEWKFENNSGNVTKDTAKIDWGLDGTWTTGSGYYVNSASSELRQAASLESWRMLIMPWGLDEFNFRHPLYNLEKQFTISFWFKAEGDLSSCWDGSLFLYLYNTYSWDFYFMFGTQEEGGIYFGLFGGTFSHPSCQLEVGISDKVVIHDRWNHLSATYDGAQLRLYINGQKASTSPCSIDIGGDPPSSDAEKNRIIIHQGYCDGFYIDNLRIYNGSFVR